VGSFCRAERTRRRSFKRRVTLPLISLLPSYPSSILRSTRSSIDDSLTCWLLVLILLCMVQAYSYSCLTAVPEPGFIGVAYETVLPGSAIKVRVPTTCDYPRQLFR
jgi:hypothetical protein